MEDIIIRGGTVIDGTGKPGYRADVAVRDGRITAIGDLAKPYAHPTEGLKQSRQPFLGT